MVLVPQKWQLHHFRWDDAATQNGDTSTKPNMESINGAFTHSLGDFANVEAGIQAQFHRIFLETKESPASALVVYVVTSPQS